MSLKDPSTGTSFMSRILGRLPAVRHVNLEYGIRMEPVARQLYESEMAKVHTQFSCSTTGLHVLEDSPLYRGFTRWHCQL